MYRNITRRGLTWMVVSAAVVIVSILGSAAFFTPVHAQVQVCGNGSAPDYGFTYSLQQAHWTVASQGYVSEQTLTEVDAILDQLNNDSIAQTMILIQPQEQVGNRVNCAVHFLRYMKLGLATGERKDNGFAFLIVVEPERIDVHYGVGLGLPALTAPELTALNRSAEETYQSTHSLDQTLLALIQGFDTVARNKYTPLVVPAPTPETTNLPTLPSGPLGILTICGLACLGLLLLPFLFWVLTQMARMGITFSPSGFGPSGRGGSFGGGQGGSSTRGGGGSGRSGRGN